MRAIALTAAAVVALTACGGTATPAATPSPATFTAKGAVLAFGASQTNAEGEPCAYTSRDGEDIREGLRLVVSNASGTTVAIGRLDAGTLTLGADPPATQKCVFPFTIPGVPDGAKFYGLTIGARKRVDVAAAELRSGTLQIDANA